MTLDDFAGGRPVFRFEEYFAGRTMAWGFAEDRFGNVRRQFTIALDGSWQGDEFLLRERFTYDDGETLEREWRVRRDVDGSFRATAADAPGGAVGRSAGNAAHFRYALTLPGSAWTVQADDWMFLQDERSLLNRIVLSKWGITVGRLTIAFRRPD
jgi:hypothetical protein